MSGQPLMKDRVIDFDKGQDWQAAQENRLRLLLLRHNIPILDGDEVEAAKAVKLDRFIKSHFAGRFRPVLRPISMIALLIACLSLIIGCFAGLGSALNNWLSFTQLPLLGWAGLAGRTFVASSILAWATFLVAGQVHGTGWVATELGHYDGEIPERVLEKINRVRDASQGEGVTFMIHSLHLDPYLKVEMRYGYTCESYYIDEWE